MERTLTLDDLREFEQYPGLAVDRKAHFSRFANKTIVHRDYHRNYTLMTYILLFFIFAFIGWIWEVGIHIVEDGVFVNRGTMFGPWLPIYGFGGVCGIILLKRFIDHHVATFFLVVGLCSVVEYVTSWYLLQKIIKKRCHDVYSCTACKAKYQRSLKTYPAIDVAEISCVIPIFHVLERFKIPARYVFDHRA